MWNFEKWVTPVSLLNGIIQYLSDIVTDLSFCVMSLRFIHVVACESFCQNTLCV